MALMQKLFPVGVGDWTLNMYLVWPFFPLFELEPNSLSFLWHNSHTYNDFFFWNCQIVGAYLICLLLYCGTFHQHCYNKNLSIPFHTGYNILHNINCKPKGITFRKYTCCSHHYWNIKPLCTMLLSDYNKYSTFQKFLASNVVQYKKNKNEKHELKPRIHDTVVNIRQISNKLA